MPRSHALETPRRRTLRWPAARDSVAVIVAATVSAVLIFGGLYDALDTAVRRWADHDLARRAELLASAIAGRIDSAAPSAVVNAYPVSADLAGVALCQGATLLAKNEGAASLQCRSAITAGSRSPAGSVFRIPELGRDVAVSEHRLREGTTLFVLQNRGFIDRRRKDFLAVLCAAAELALIALLLLARAGMRIGGKRVEEGVRGVMKSLRSPGGDPAAVTGELAPLVRDIRETVEHLRLRRDSSGASGAEKLRTQASLELGNARLVVVANREPYAHEWQAGRVVVRQPASGLVTGIEPLLRACNGTWIARGGGSADRMHCDANGRLAVPPAAPDYTLRRLFVADEEYDRYYRGAANEALWPLCHMAHAQPFFHPADWRAYGSVNEVFARAAVEEAGSEGMLLVQDYHFALIPRIVRERAPHLVSSIFWHIPWPNAEVIGICPWKEELLDGMLGADVVGFHTRQFCLNFLDTVQRYVECRVDREEMSVTCGGRTTLVRANPISVEWPYPAAPRTEGARLRRELGIRHDAHVSIGVDRADYTKGLLERFAAVEILLEQNPALIGAYVLVQLASPSRTRIRRYAQLGDDLRKAAERINQRFGTAEWQPIVLQMRAFPPEEVRCYYALADSALVTPLHDGMNLVAKEYVASCEDEEGVLVLSMFAGAAKELGGALLVSPYDIEQMAEAILRAVTMPSAERHARMAAMRRQVAANSIYDWSARLLRDMCDVRRERAQFWPRRDAATDRSVRVAG